MRTSRVSALAAGAGFVAAVGLTAVALASGPDQPDTTTATTTGLESTAAQKDSGGGLGAGGTIVGPDPTAASPIIAAAPSAEATASTADGDATDPSVTRSAAASAKAGSDPAAPAATPTPSPTPSAVPATPLTVVTVPSQPTAVTPAPTITPAPSATPTFNPTKPSGQLPWLEHCGDITPTGWPSTTAPDLNVGRCLARNLTAGTPAVATEISYLGPGNNGPEYRHVITYRVIDRNLLERRTDWTDATGPVGTITLERCTGLDTSFGVAVSGCRPA